MELYAGQMVPCLAASVKSQAFLIEMVSVTKGAKGGGLGVNTADHTESRFCNILRLARDDQRYRCEAQFTSNSVDLSRVDCGDAIIGQGRSRGCGAIR